MNGKLKPGMRVRVTTANAMPGFRPGDTGTLKEGPYPSAIGGHYYVVQMDNDVGGGPAIFMAEEIEPAE